MQNKEQRKALKVIRFTLGGVRKAAVQRLNAYAEQRLTADIPIYKRFAATAAQGFKYSKMYYIYLLFKMLLNKSCASFSAKRYSLFSVGQRYTAITAIALSVNRPRTVIGSA